MLHLCRRIRHILHDGSEVVASEPRKEDDSYNIRIPPPVQRWNLDILDCVMQHLSASDLAAAASVCRDWALAARVTLYAQIYFDTDLDNATLLARTMRGTPCLLPLVRSISICVGLPERADVDWLQLLPTNTVHTFCIKQLGDEDEDNLATSILSAPFIRNVRHLVCRTRFIHNCDHVKTCFALPHLESLRLWASFPVDEIQSISVPPKLTHLHMSLYNYSIFVLRVLAVLGPQLEDFELFVNRRHPIREQIPEFFGALERHAHHVRRLSIRSIHVPRRPYLDSIAHILPSLEDLHVGPGTYTSALLNNIPLHVRRLSLDHDYSIPQFPFKALKKLISRAGRGECRLESLAIYLRWNHSDTAPYTSLEGMCKKRGIEFEVKIWSKGMQSKGF